MNTRNTNGSYHIGLTFFDALCLVFIVLKLTHVIDWSWWIILAPIWATLLIVIIVLTILFIVGKL